MSSTIEYQYQKLLSRVLEHGDRRETRNGTVLSVFGASLECDLKEGFPLLTSKRVFFRGIVEELAWFLRGSTNVNELRDKKVHIWDLNSEQTGFDAGPIYGFQWRHFGAPYTDCHADYKDKGIDQIKSIIDLLKTDPHSRRMILSAWCPTQQQQMCLPPCHVMYQFYVESDGRLSVQMTQRSSDVFLGLPFNIASTALLVHLIAHQLDRDPGRILIQIGDTHIYEEHIEAVHKQLTRTPKLKPKVTISGDLKDIDDVRVEHFILEDYESHEAIKAPMIA